MSHSDKMATRFAELPYLLAERPRTQKELADHFKADRKTIKRSINTLKKRHKITETKEGRHVYYYSVDRYKRPNFTPLEMATILRAGNALGSPALTQTTSLLPRHAEPLKKRVRDPLPPSLSEKLAAMAAVSGSATAPAKDFTLYAGTIDRLTAA